MDYAKKQAEEDTKTQKKIFKSLRSAAYCFGSGLGLMFVPVWFDHENENQQVVDAFNNIGYYLIAFALSLLITFVFARKHIITLNSLIAFFGYPTILVIFGMDIYEITQS